MHSCHALFAVVCLCMTTLSACSFTQPVVEITTRSVLAPLPLNVERLEAWQYCRKHTEADHVHDTEQAHAAALDREVEAYQAMVEASLVYRAETLQLVNRLKSSLDKREPISGKDLAELNAGLAEHLTLRKQLFRIAEAHECWIGTNGPAEGMSPALRLKGIMISLSASLVLYDNYLLAISLYQEEPRLRMLLNNKDVGYEMDYGEVNRVAMSFASEENRKRVRRGIAYYEDKIGNFRALLDQDKHLLFIDQTITQSPSYSMTRHFSPLSYLGRKIGFYIPFTAEALLRLKDEGLNMASMIFGNTVGLVESRRGKLHGRTDVAMKLADQLQAGDILVERTPFRLTNSFIPGRWGHAALWVGTEPELRALGIWNNPLVQPHQDSIQAGDRVLEALRSGVNLNTLERFLNVDDLVVLRLAKPTPAEKAEAILQGLRQIGKRYDFNFDVETRDRIGCAELLYHAYGQIDWPTHKQLGRSVIIPDDITARALGDTPLTAVSLYTDGTRVDGNPGQALARLMEQPQ